MNLTFHFESDAFLSWIISPEIRVQKTAMEISPGTGSSATIKDWSPPSAPTRSEENVQTPNEQLYDKTNKKTFAPSEDSDQPGHPPSLTSSQPGTICTMLRNTFWWYFYRVFAVRSMGSEGPKVSSCGQRRLIRLADLNLWWAHGLFCWFCHAVNQMRTYK